MSEKKHLYQDKSGVIHSCEKGKGPPGIVLVWTKCEKDVPANSSFLSDEKVLCKQCLTTQTYNQKCELQTTEKR